MLKKLDGFQDNGIEKLLDSLDNSQIEMLYNIYKQEGEDFFIYYITKIYIFISLNWIDV